MSGRCWKKKIDGDAGGDVLLVNGDKDRVVVLEDGDSDKKN